ncbi:MAG: hypothetical protein HKN62_05955 [Phycisphaerales bacterium]|nr:hypothetical protein [Phycisphaerales bacterium]
MTRASRRTLGRSFAAAAILITGSAALAGGGDQVQLPTTVEDFFQPGTQPNEGGAFEDVVSSGSCTFCHAEYVPEYDEPWDAWTTSLKAQAARDPVWLAALAISNQDAHDSGEYCIRCHAPGAWLGGRSLPSDGSGFIMEGFVNDFEGITCHFCHRSMNAVVEDDSPPEDDAILAALEFPPGEQRGNGRFVVDPSDVRRGPYDDVPQNLHGVPIIYSPVHRRSELCASCHDLGNPVYEKQPDGTYAVTSLDAPHPTQDINDMFPEQKTYSEWLNSQFADGGVFYPDGRFGGNHPTGVMEECQDCHMPDQFNGGCSFFEFEPFFARPDLPQHSFNGANHWVLKAILALDEGIGDAGLSEKSVAAALSRTSDMLRAASDVQVQQLADTLRVRVINFSGHKLPTGYPEGRRMWLNVKFYDEIGDLITEHGAYDFDTATLAADDTKVYEAEAGIDETVADVVGLPAGRSFHLSLNNVKILDNRIPPIGFTNKAFDAANAGPVGYAYADGQYWDDTDYEIPDGAASMTATLYYQSMTREYMEFLRDANVTNDAGQIVYDLWADPLVGGKAAPIDMDMIDLELTPPIAGDTNGDGIVDFVDLLTVLAAWGPCPPPDLCPGDVNGDGVIDFTDLLTVLAGWTL